MNYIIAGRISEAIDWRARNNCIPNRWRYLGNADFLRGQSEVHGIFIGTWRERQDMSQIFSVLLTMQSTNPGISRAFLEYQIYLKEKNASV